MSEEEKFDEAVGGVSVEEMDLIHALRALGISSVSSDDMNRIAQMLKGTDKDQKPVIPSSQYNTPPVPHSALHQYPKFSIFYGEDGKGEVTWDTFKYEVDAALAQGIFSRPQILAGVRRSIKGCASDKVRRLGPAANLDQVMSHLSIEYGIVETDETIMKKFYGCSQKSGESVEKFASRLEDIHDKAIELGAISRTNKKILRSRLHGGLRPELKQISSYHFDKSTSYEEFKKELRRIEAGASADTPVTAKPVVKPEKEDSEVTKLLKQIHERIDKLEKKQSISQPEQQDRSYRVPVNNFRPPDHDYRTTYNRGGRGRGQFRNRRPTYEKTFTPTCFLCGEKGHIQRNCPTILSQLICTSCKKKGHVRKDCPNF